MNSAIPSMLAPTLRARIVGAIALLSLGMVAAGLGYGLFGPSDDAGLANPPAWPQRWMFWAIWLVLYPAAGVAGAWLWADRCSGRASATAWRLYAVSVMIALAWVPVVQASGSRLVMPVIMDIIGLAIGLAAFVAAARVNRRAMFWLIPINVWGLLTTVLKVWRLLLNV